MVFKCLTIFVIFIVLSSISSIEKSEKSKIISDELDIKIDMKNLISEFDEKVNYTLKLKNNDLNLQKIEKILPEIENVKLFDLKVTSEKANIIKFNITDIKDPKDSNKKKKILNIEYKLKNKEK